MLPIRIPLPRFVSAGEILGGAGSLGALRALDAAKASVLVSSSVLARHRSVIEKSIGSEVVDIVEMPKGEPALERLHPVIARLERFRPDWIIAIGGGSVIDGAKIAWVLYEHPGVAIERLLRTGGVPTLRGKARFAAVPTTAGTGSEVSSAALLIGAEGVSKQVLVSHDLLPDIAVLDPRLAVGCPPGIIANAGLDALAHAVESYVSRLQNPLADTLAEKAVTEIFGALPTFVDDPEDEALALRVMNAALLAGWVQNQKIPGVGHAIAHQLAGFGVAHGHAAGRLLTGSIRANASDDATRAKFERLAQSTGFGGLDQLCGAIDSLVDGLGTPPLPDTLAASISAITDGAMEDFCARANPIPVYRGLVENVLEASL